MSGPSREQWITIRRRLRTWSHALRCAAEEHGRPNSFGVVELAGEYGLTPRDGYYLGTIRLHDLWQSLAAVSSRGSCPTYAKGRFYL